MDYFRHQLGGPDMNANQLHQRSVLVDTVRPFYEGEIYQI